MATTERLAIEVKPLIITVPPVRLHGEAIRSVWCTLVVAVNLGLLSADVFNHGIVLARGRSRQEMEGTQPRQLYYKQAWEQGTRVNVSTHQFDILQFILFAWLDILLPPHMRHIAIIILAILVIRRVTRVEYEAVNPLAMKGLG